ncbi:MAG: TIGR04372 family glycosyltransferase [Candidatus Rokubacteria bacterium]|nr:TIGR04372 family glycosyltransferase [Candidatus Rokubacteria bacterium]
MIAVLRRLARRAPWLVRAAVSVIRGVIGAATFLEAPLFLLRHRRLFRNPLGYVFWVWSFGHNIFELDYVARLYYPHRISLISMPDPRANTYFSYCFERNVDTVVFRSVLDPLLERLERRLVLFPVRRAQYRVMRGWLLLVSAVHRRFTAIDQHATIARTLSLVPEEGMWIGRESTGDLVPTDDLTGYIRLLRDGIGRPPRMPAGLRRQCEDGIRRRHPTFFDRPFVTLLLRQKGRNSEDFSDSVRVAGPPKNYLPAVRHLTAHGYNVVGSGETAHEVFESVPGYYALRDVDVPPKLLNLYLLLHCAMYIGQASGPNWMGSTVGYPTLVCDGVWYSGTCRETDLILYKPYYEAQTGRRLSIVEVFREHADLVFGYNFARKGIRVGANSDDEILEGVKETLAAMEGRLVLSDDDRRLCEAYLALLPPRAIIASQRNRPPLYVLRQYEKELLETV